MRSTYKYIISILVVIGVAVPFAVKSSTDRVIQSEKQSMLANGVELNISKQSGFLTTTREYKLKIINGKEFRDYLLVKFIQNNPDYKDISRLVKQNSEQDIGAVLDGTTFSGTLKTSNLLLASPLIELSLVKLSDEIMSSIKREKEIYDTVKPMLDEKMITFYITLDSHQKVSKIVMKDIDKKINNSTQAINFKLLNHSLELEINEASSGVYKLGKESIGTDDFLFEMNGLDYKFYALTKFDNITFLHVDSIKFKENKSSAQIGDIDVKNSIKILNDKTITVDSDYSIEDIAINAQEKLKLDEFTFAMNITDLNRDGLISASRAYNTLVFNAQNATNKEIQLLRSSVQKILNQGLKADIKSSFSKLLLDKTDLGDMDFELDAKIKPNSYTFDTPELMNALSLKGSFTISQKSINRALQANSTFERFTRFGKQKGKKVVFEYELKDGQLLINDKKIF